MLVHFVQNVWIARVLPLRLWAYIPFLDRAAAFDGFGDGRAVSRCVTEDGVLTRFARDRNGLHVLPLLTTSVYLSWISKRVTKLTWPVRMSLLDI